MKKRLKSWARTVGKLLLLVLCYFWIGAAYKAVYAQTHDITRLKKKVPLPYYQQEFLVDSILHQTWILGSDFQQFIGELPNLAALVSGNPFSRLADYFARRERELATLPDRYPRSLYAEAALADASAFFSGSASLLNMLGERERPRQGFTAGGRGGEWQESAVPDFSRQTELSLRLANEYPDSPQAPPALKRVAEFDEQNGLPEEAQALYRRIAMEYPRSEEAEAAAQALYTRAVARGDWESARSFKLQALASAERRAREQHAGRALPAAETVNLLGLHVDLSGLNLQLRALAEARSELELAQSGAGRLRAMGGLDDRVREDLRRVRERLDRTTSELWVADFFRKLEVGVPGPPPRPKEHAVQGRVEVDGMVLPGVQVQLADLPRNAAGMGQRFQGGPFAFLAPARFRAVTDSRGRYRISGVPSGEYLLRALYPFCPAAAGGEPVIPIGLAEGGGSRGTGAEGGAVRVEDRALSLPPLRFRRAVRTVTFGETPPEGSALRLRWEAFPQAAAYRVEVRPTAMMAGLFRSRLKAPEGLPPGRLPEAVSLWKSRPVSGTSVDCPLMELAPDAPQAARAAQYQYVVRALDARGAELTRSAWPLGRFHLSPRAVAALLELHPPARRSPGRRGLFRGPGWRLRKPRLGGAQR